MEIEMKDLLNFVVWLVSAGVIVGWARTKIDGHDKDIRDMKDNHDKHVSEIKLELKEHAVAINSINVQYARIETQLADISLNIIEMKRKMQ